jgi:hypothetical protein
LTVLYHAHHRYGQCGEFKDHGGHCRCETEECQDSGKEEPLPMFRLPLPLSLEVLHRGRSGSSTR